MQTLVTSKFRNEDLKPEHTVLVASLEKLRNDLKGFQSDFARNYGTDPSKVSRVLNGKLYDAQMIDALINFRNEVTQKQKEEIVSLTERI